MSFCFRDVNVFLLRGYKCISTLGMEMSFYFRDVNVSELTHVFGWKASCHKSTDSRLNLSYNHLVSSLAGARQLSQSQYTLVVNLTTLLYCDWSNQMVAPLVSGIRNWNIFLNIWFNPTTIFFHWDKIFTNWNQGLCMCKLYRLPKISHI